MTGLNHATTGIVIALVVKQPVLAMPLALLSHFVLDAVPHSVVAPRKNVMVPYLIAEALAATTITLICMFAFPSMWFLIGACALLAFAPDFLWPFFYGGQLRDKPFFKQFYAFHKKIQWSETYRGWVVEALYFSVLVIFISTYQV